jgi:hypothetical protein
VSDWPSSKGDFSNFPTRASASPDKQNSSGASLGLPTPPDMGGGQMPTPPSTSPDNSNSSGTSLDLPTPPTIGGSEMPDPPGLDATPPDTSVTSPEDADVVRNRDDSMLKPPPAEDPTHKDQEVQANEKTLLLRWDKNLGYVVVGEKTGSGEMKMYSESEFKQVNAEQKEEAGGGRIPSATSQKPEFYVPPDGDKALIYRYDDKTGKDVIVGVRANGERSYFQSQATMDAVNKAAGAAGLGAPARPVTVPGKTIPSDSKFNSGYVNRNAGATNNDGKTYIWRYDKTAGRYCAVGESTSESGFFKWYNEDEYRNKNSGPNAPVMQGADVKAPVTDRGQGETVDTDHTVRFIQDDPADVDSGNGTERRGNPVFTTDPNTGQKVYIGVQLDDGGTKKIYYFDERHLKDFNESIDINGKSYFKARDLDKLSPDLVGEKRVDPEVGGSVGGGGGETAPRKS